MTQSLRQQSFNACSTLKGAAPLHLIVWERGMSHRLGSDKARQQLQVGWRSVACHVSYTVRRTDTATHCQATSLAQLASWPSTNVFS
ncbi:hypothetical protein E2C01_087962 [Portunus trituberculatus]|uniref:Uncharacterized protein n=1 Tax=Portunus trituberculatus TaxID=210409 RepID=A0A5B7J4W3_PORTR|nr:hypothetical protein [Portunus trituberculatus]